MTLLHQFLVISTVTFKLSTTEYKPKYTQNAKYSYNLKDSVYFHQIFSK